MTAISDLAAVDGSVVVEVKDVFSNTYTVAPAYNPQPLEPGNTNSADPIAWCDHCYDDNGWWSLAWMQAWDIANDQEYLDLARGIFDKNMINSGPTKCGNGGVVWCDNNPYVNAIGNELFLSVSAHLANRVDDTDKDYYANIAQKQWEWFQGSGLINSDNLINDGLEDNCTNTGLRDIWSYNQGVILGALVELDRARPNQSVIDSANTLAQAAIGHLCDSNHIVHDKCEPDCAPDATQFKGIFIRNLVALHKRSPNDLYKTVINANAESIFDNDRVTSNNTFGVNWAGPIQSRVEASTSSSALDGLIGAVVICQ